MSPEPGPSPLPFSPPFVGEEEERAVASVVRSGWISTGERTAQLERGIAAMVHAPSAVATNSCTGAMHAALAAAGVGPGDAVITTTFTFCATVNVIEHLGATPVLVDVDRDTLNISVEALERALRTDAETHGPGRVRAIIVVHFAGHAAPIDTILEVAATWSVSLVLEDAAHALGASFNGVPVGDVSAGSGGVQRGVCFSFYATKNLTTGEGGMLCGDEAFVDRTRPWVLHGMTRDAWKRYEAGASWQYDVLVPGFKYNMSDLQAALGLVQLRRFTDMQTKREAIATAYLRGLADLGGVTIPTVRPGAKHAWHLFPLRIPLEVDRNEFIGRMERSGVAVSVHFIPVHTFSYYRDRYRFSVGDFPVAETEGARVVSLPMHPGLPESDVDRVIHAVHDALR